MRDLPGGVVITGGVAQLEGIAQLARQVMQTRVRIYIPDYIGVREPSFTTAVGLIRYAYADDEFYGRQEEQDVALVAASHTPPKQKVKKVEKNDGENKSGVLDAAKKLFNKFFE